MAERIRHFLDLIYVDSIAPFKLCTWLLGMGWSDCHLLKLKYFIVKCAETQKLGNETLGKLPNHLA